VQRIEEWKRNRGQGESPRLPLGDEELEGYASPITEITFETPTHNFGTVVDGDMVKHSFKFTNTGDKDLVLFGVNATCGCTVPEDWPKNPIAPGEGGEIKVIFNSLNKVGAVNKTVNVEANTNPTVSRITIMGEVLAKKQ
jgi:hypothetical protein